MKKSKIMSDDQDRKINFMLIRLRNVIGLVGFIILVYLCWKSVMDAEMMTDLLMNPGYVMTDIEAQSIHNMWVMYEIKSVIYGTSAFLVLLILLPRKPN